MKNYRLLIKYGTWTLLGTSVGWMYYQIRKTHEILENLLDLSVLNTMDSPTYVYDTNQQGNDFLYTSKVNRKSVFERFWISMKFAYARRLLSLTNNDNTVVRTRAVRSLAKIKNLDNWHCSLLASRIDARTAVGLARTHGSDKRLLSEPPLRYLTYNTTMLLSEMKGLLCQLYERSKHHCVGYFISKIFVDDYDAGHDIDNENIALELNKFLQSTSNVLPMCVESLLHHCSIEAYTKDLVDLNGLPLLLEIHNRYKDNIEVSVSLCRILSYLSIFPELLEPIFKSGWIGILAEWMYHEDVRISVPAARALANLDTDDGPIYSRCIYLLHPILKTYQKTDIDVVFVHGLLGGVFYTWRQRYQEKAIVGLLGKNSNHHKNGNESLLPDTALPKIHLTKRPTNDSSEIEKIVKDFEMVCDDIPVNTNTSSDDCYTRSANSPTVKECDKDDCYTYCWPKDWLCRDCKNLRVIGINYNTSLSMWAPICPTERTKLTLDERSDALMDVLLKAGLGNKPIVWVTHSMGGLIVKNILCKAFQNDDQHVNNLCRNTKAIVFYSTPHKGSRLANLSQATSLLLWPSVEVQELRENSPQLMKIHENFLTIVNDIPIKVVTFVETKSTVVTAMKLNFLLVEPDSGNPGVGEYYEVPQDHLGICKPVNRLSFIYQKVVQILKDIAKQVED